MVLHALIVVLYTGKILCLITIEYIDGVQQSVWENICIYSRINNKTIAHNMQYKY